jgi:N-acetylmuramoyl-L-alanine amidase
MGSRAVPPRRRAVSPSASPNHGPRRGDGPVDIAVLHYTAMAEVDGARARLCDPAFEVSAHWLVTRCGACEALVTEDRRAWHAGAARWGELRDVNSRSIGIELDNDGASPFPGAQIGALVALLRGVVMRHPGIVPARVLGHSDVSPARKVDPGPLFPWWRLVDAGLAVPTPEEGAAGCLRDDLTRIGYDPDAPEADRLRAFRLRFRPMAAGPATARDAALAAGVASCWPCAALDPGAARA